MILEPQIAPLVNAMNASGQIKTLASCHGHWDGRKPYVYFTCAVALATAFDEILRVGGENGLYPLNFWWNVIGRFHPERGLVFMLETTAEDRTFIGSLLGSPWTLGLSRRQIDADLKTLILVLEEVLLKSIRQNLCNSIEASHD
jgi:hypothetical protein